MKIITPKNIRPELQEAIMSGTAPDECIAQLLMSGSIAYDGTTYGHYSPIHRMTNEPFETYFKKEDIEGKDVLTVNGSGDFLTWVIQNKPSSVSTFDINIFTEYYQMLKMGALLTLDYSEYLDFFYGDNVLDEKYFPRVLSVLPEHIVNFWESLLDYFDPIEINESQLFVPSVTTINNARRYNSFLRDSESYNKAREAATKLCYAFHNLAFDELGEIKKKFDTIFLSNIVDYQNYHSALDAISKLRSALESILKDDGIIIASSLNSKSLMPNYIGPNGSIIKRPDFVREIRVKACKH